MTNKKLFLAIQKCLLITAFATSMVMANDVSNTIQTITQQDIINSGLNNLGDILNEMVIANGEVLNQFKNYGGDGSTTVNFRGLGSNRVLVLFNGKRQATNVQGAFDFSNIPLSIIQKVEISQSNGTDSISGTINIITRDEFTGIETNAYYGKSSRNDVETQNYNISLGKKSEKGSVFFNAEFSKNAPIYAGARDISALPIYGTGLNNGSSATPQGRFIFYDENSNFIDVTTSPGSNGFNSPDDPDLIAFTHDNRFNYAPVNFLLTPQERKSIYINGKYNINNNITAHADVLFTRKESMQQEAPTPLFIGGWGDTIITDVYNTESLIGIGAQNPYNPYGYDLVPEDYSDTSNFVLLGRRMVEMGNRTTKNQVDSFNVDVGLKGTIIAKSNWDWNINYSQSKIDGTDNLDNLVNLYKVAEALSNECVDDASCVPLNLFGGEGSITPEMNEYIKYASENIYSNTVSTFSAQARSTLAQLDAGELNLSTGVEYRKLSGFYHPDTFYNTVVASRSTGANRQVVDGSYSVNEFFVDLNVPLIAKKLALNFKSKYSKYDFTDKAFSGQFSIEYKPMKSILINLDYSQLINPPNLYQLFKGEDLSFPYIDDICVYERYRDLPGCGGIVLVQTGAAYPVYFEGNNNLDLEKSNLVSLKIKYQPSQIENLEINLYGNIQSSDNMISRSSGNGILYACVFTGDPIYCDRVLRSSSGYLQGLRPTFLNDGRFEQTNVGLDANYKFSIGSTNYKLNWNNFYLLKQSTYKRNYTEGTMYEIDYLDITSYGYLDSEIPQFSSNLAVNIQRGDWTVNYQLRYIAGYNEKCGNEYRDSQIVPNADPNAVGGVVPEDFRWCNTQIPSQRKVGGSAFQDMNFTYDFPEFKANVMLGVENIFDKTPPLSSSAFANSYNSSLYNGTGRYFWVRFSKQF